jgi:hypothetical protein
MTPKQYNAMPEGDNKLAVRLAITLGWDVARNFLDGQYVQVRDKELQKERFSPWVVFDPFTDASIPYGLIGHHNVFRISAYSPTSFYIETNRESTSMYALSKTHAIIQAFCAADLQGHWARFMKGGE